MPVIAIFGANASGKSNVLKALDYLLNFLTIGNYDNGSHLIPFKLDKQSVLSPSHFHLRTAFNGTIYTYSLILNSARILSEKFEYALLSTRRSRLLYSRIWNEENKKFDWKNGSDFSGSHIQLEKSLKERESFINIFCKLEVEVVEPFARWLGLSRLGSYCGHQDFDGRIINLLWGEQFSNTQSADLLPEVIESSKNLLLKFDTGLYDIEIKKIEDNENGYQVYALHKIEDTKIISWKFEEESMGTQKLFNLACRIQLMFLLNSLVIADELGSNIHPNITYEIVKLFQNPETNPNQTQLIFTSHDNTLQRNNLLRRDQIWFTQKRPDQSTELYSLSDFKVRNDLAIDKAYLDGRFGAVPFISDENDLMLVGEDNG